MRVRVLWVVKGLGPGGAERLLAAAARAHDGERFEIECAYVLPWKDHLVGELESAGVRTHCLSRRRSDPRWPMRLWSLVRDGAFDVVHVHSPLPGSVARAAARTMPADVRPGIVSTEHNRWETHRPPTRFANRLTGRWDDAALAVTDEVRSSMAGPVAARVTTVRHGIDVAAIATAVEHRAEIRAELGLTPDELAIGTVANFRPQKDYPNLLRAARLLADPDVAVRVVAVGQGPQEAEVRALRDELGVSDRVVLTGFRDDAVRVMGACDAFALASQWEGLPVAIMEALALGLPIVATNVGGMAEELTDDVDALLVPPRDPDALAAAIERLVTDDDLRTRLAAASRAKAAEFDVARTVEVIEQTYTRVARTGSADPTGPESTQSRQQPPTPAPSDTESPGGRRGRAAGLDIRAATVDDRDAILEVLRRSLGGDDDPRYPELFAWKHDENSFGPSPMWVATDGGRIAGFRTFLRWEFERDGHVLRAVRAVDTATDPDYQGRGLFTALTRHALAEVEAEGVDFVFNTPNDQSRPGYLKMGWREVGRLPAAVRFTGPAAAKKALRSKVPADRWSQELAIGRPVHEWIDSGGAATALASRTAPTDVRTIRTRVDESFLRWRFATPLLGYRVVEHGDTTVIVRARNRGEALELVLVAAFGDPTATDRLAASAAKEAGADYVIRLGPPNPRTGYLPLPGGGPIFTWRAVNDHGFPPLPNWNLTLGDIELF
ncbi:MAG: GNAT family N-acetyltransferase [Ilumatobacteraceae bacterium]